jgi:hypothetical protein
MIVEVSEELLALVKQFRNERNIALHSNATEGIKTDASVQMLALAMNISRRIASRLEAVMSSSPPVEPAKKSLYYIQDTRQVVGNCVLWWCSKGAGYTCDISEAGCFTEEEIKGRRDTDVPWPCEEIDALTVKHVRAETLRAVR